MTIVLGMAALVRKLDFVIVHRGDTCQRLDLYVEIAQRCTPAFKRFFNQRADLVAFVGHNGLMDFELEDAVEKKDTDQRDAIILACASRQYFAEHLKKTSANPLLWTTNLMAPEAYILHDALEGWANTETPAQIRTRGAAAYAKYQRISQKSAERLLVTGF